MMIRVSIIARNEAGRPQKKSFLDLAAAAESCYTDSMFNKERNMPQATTTPDTLTQLQEALSRHDWYYGYSDDHSVWSRGHENAQRIWSLRWQAIREGREAEAEALYTRYAK
jgi:hypothetical protein